MKPWLRLAPSYPGHENIYAPCSCFPWGWIQTTRIILLSKNDTRWKYISTAQCKTAVTPERMHRSYCSLALSHWHINASNHFIMSRANKPKEISTFTSVCGWLHYVSVVSPCPSHPALDPSHSDLAEVFQSLLPEILRFALDAGYHLSYQKSPLHIHHPEMHKVVFF